MDCESIATLNTIKEFLATSFAINDGTSFVMQHNQHDIEVFQFAKKLFCGRLFAKIGLFEEMKQVGLGLEEIDMCQYWLW